MLARDDPSFEDGGDLILYCSTEFGFVKLSDAVSTGSSLMPQKKNPGCARAHSRKGRTRLRTSRGPACDDEGLPLAYNKDMQEDKEAVFDTVDTVGSCLRVAAIVPDNLSLDEARMRDSAAADF
jgi:argininosuccinate lyase